METFTFPSDSIAPEKKDRSWILQFIKAAYSTSKGRMPNSLYFGINDLDEVRAYANGRPPIGKYKKMRGIADQADDSWEVIDYSPVDYLSKIRNIVVAKICQRAFDVQCSAVDPLSRSEEDKRFNAMKVKLTMYDMAQKQGSELAESPVLKPALNEPQDMEQLAMEKDFGYKHILSMEAEMGIQLVQQQNNFDEKRKNTIENIVDFGIGGYVNYIDHNGSVKVREVEPRNLGLSPCVKSDFSDLYYWFEVIEVCLGEIANYFEPFELKRIAESVKGQNGNLLYWDYNNDDWQHKCKVLVVDCKFKSYNSIAYQDEASQGGMSVGENGIEYLGGDEQLGGDAYIGKTREYIYKGKWIIDTKYIYDYGESENMVRKESSWTKTQLDIQLRAINFDRMMFSGLTKRLIPLQDQINLIWYRLQNLAAKLIPYIISLDMSALEGVAYGKGGAKNSPENITEFLFSNFVALYRSQNLLNPSNNQAMKPVSIDPSGQLYAFGELRNQLLMNVEQMKQIAGLNDITDASTPNAKNLNSTNQAAIEATNNALYNIQKADEFLIVDNADNIVQKLQIAVKFGKVEGYFRAMGQDTITFMQINPDISMREFGIFAEVVPSSEERQMLFQDVTLKESQGLLDITDKELVMSCRNLKMAMKILGYRIKKRKEEAQAFEMQKIQHASETQTQMSLQVEQMKQQTIGVQLQADLVRIQTEMQWQYQIQAMSKQMDYNAESTQVQGRIVGHEIQSEAKIISSHIAAEASKEKQVISNKKPIAKKKS